MNKKTLKQLKNMAEHLSNHPVSRKTALQAQKKHDVKHLGTDNYYRQRKKANTKCTSWII